MGSSLVVIIVATTNVLYGRVSLGSAKAFFRLLIIPRNAFFTKGGASAHFTLGKLKSVHLCWAEERPVLTDRPRLYRRISGRMKKVAFKLKIETKHFFVTVVAPWIEWISKGESTGLIPFSSLVRWNSLVPLLLFGCWRVTGIFP